MSFSKTDEKCIKCHYFDDCDSKRMVACAVIDDTGMNAAQPVLREEVEIHITNNISGMIYKDELKRQIEKQMYKGLQCPFNYGV